LLWAVRADGSVWLERRPTPGIWAGLYCLPVFTSQDALASAVPAPEPRDLEYLPVVEHALTHKDLSLHPVRIPMAGGQLTPGDGGEWFSAGRWPGLGLPAPIRKILGAAA
jgi:A/G-specific adenine glycosylase